jgi:hypothetical protein
VYRHRGHDKGGQVKVGDNKKVRRVNDGKRSERFKSLNLFRFSLALKGAAAGSFLVSYNVAP